MKTIKYFGLILAAAASLSSVANGQVVYYAWEANGANQYATSGSITTVNGAITSFTFTDGPDGTYNSFSTAGFGSVSVLADDNLQLVGISAGSPLLEWNIPGPAGVGAVPASGPIEDVAQDGISAYGDWVPVPEPTTLIAGALLLLPFGASSVRVVRRNRAA